MVQAIIPDQTALETNPPAIFASRLALREGNYKKPIYQIHKWWARRLGAVFRSLLIAATRGADEVDVNYEELFYEKQDLTGLVVMDPFIGGGTSAVESAKCNANVIGVDIDPVASFITAKELDSCDESTLLTAFHSVEEQVKDNVIRWYRTKLPDGREGTIIYTFWVDQITCPNCKVETSGHPHYQLNRDRRNKRQVVFCSHCEAVSTLHLTRVTLNCKECEGQTNIKVGPVKRGVFTCPNCEETNNVRSLINKKQPLSQKIFALEVLIDETGERVFKKADANDLKLYESAQTEWQRRQKVDKFVPSDAIPSEGRTDQRPISYGYLKYRDLFNARQLLCLSLIAEAISNVKDPKIRELIYLAFSDCLASNNMFCYYAFDYQKLTPLFGLHAYTKVSRPVENNVWGTKAGRGSFEKCFYKLLRGKSYGKKPYEFRYDLTSGDVEKVFTGETISSKVLQALPGDNIKAEAFAVLLNRSSESLTEVKAGSVDLILTDPPYYDNLPYSELSDFYHVWLKRFQLESYSGNDQGQTPHKESLYVRRSQDALKDDHKRFADGLTRIFTECNRVLKDTGLMVFTFHHNDPKAWEVLATAIIGAGFQVTSVFPVRSEGQSQFHSAERNLKWDVVFTCRKCGEGTDLSQEGEIELLDKVRVEAEALKWVGILKAEGLAFSKADEGSLRRGFLVKLLSRLRHPTERIADFLR